MALRFEIFKKTYFLVREELSDDRQYTSYANIKIGIIGSEHFLRFRLGYICYI